MTHEGDPPYIVAYEKWGYERERPGWRHERVGERHAAFEEDYESGENREWQIRLERQQKHTLYTKHRMGNGFPGPRRLPGF